MDVQQLSPAGPRTIGEDRSRGRHAALGGGLASDRATGPGRALLVVGAVAALAACVTAALALLAGFRWFVVETPSMGTAAPVGSLVITAPVHGEVQPGGVIAFTPPGPSRTYTHRVFSVAVDGGIRTKGDINPTPDAWTIRPAAVLGEAVAIVPGLGFAVRGLPVLIAGALILWLVTAPMRRRDRRASARITGLHLVGTLVLLWLQPFVRVVLIATETGATGTKAAIVSTGLLPVRIVDSAGTVLARLTTGRPEVVPVPWSGSGTDRIVAVADLHWPLQVLLIGIAVLPALVVLVVGLPRDPEQES